MSVPLMMTPLKAPPCERRGWCRVRNGACADCGKRWDVTDARAQFRKEGDFLLELVTELEKMAQRELRTGRPPVMVE